MRKSVTLVALTLVILGKPIGAQQQADPAALARLQAKAERELARLAALKAIEADRAAVVTEISAKFFSADQSELPSWLASASAEQLLSAREAKTTDELNKLISGRDLGDNASDLVFFPLPPCRIIDTRFATPNTKLAPGTPRAFGVNGDFTSQGGSATGCGLPGTDVAAIAAAVTVTAINGPGNLRAWQQGIPAPLSSVVNYNANGESGDVANTTIIPALQDVGDPNEIQFQADVNGTHIVVDVVGYFWSPNATALNCTTVTNSVAVANGAQIDFPPGLVSPACPAGFTLTGGGNLYSGAVTGFWWWNSHPVGNTWVTAGRNQTGAGANVTVYATCCRVPGR